MSVAICYASQELIEEWLGGGWIESALTHVQKLLQVLIQVLEDQGQLSLGVDHITKPHNVGMLQFLQKRNLSDCCARNALILCFQPDCFQCVDFASWILRLVDNTVGALTHLLDLLVLLHAPHSPRLQVQGCLKQNVCGGVGSSVMQCDAVWPIAAVQISKLKTHNSDTHHNNHNINSYHNYISSVSSHQHNVKTPSLHLNNLPHLDDRR